MYVQVVCVCVAKIMADRVLIVPDLSEIYPRPIEKQH